jgi:hypothetical protein
VDDGDDNRRFQQLFPRPQGRDGLKSFDNIRGGPRFLAGAKRLQTERILAKPSFAPAGVKSKFSTTRPRRGTDQKPSRIRLTINFELEAGYDVGVSTKNPSTSGTGPRSRIRECGR